MDQEMKELMVLQDIRAAIGDKGQLMQDELVEYIKKMQAVVVAAESVVEQNSHRPACRPLAEAMKALKDKV